MQKSPIKVLCAAGIIALAVTQASAAGGKRIAYLDGPIADKYIGAMTRAFMDVAKPAGLEVNLQQSPFDPALQAQQLDDAIAQKVDLIVVMVMSQKALIPALTRAKAAHIPVVLINTEIDQTDLYTAFVGEDAPALGMAAGPWGMRSKAPAAFLPKSQLSPGAWKKVSPRCA
jgi:ABC-type sugar transport system substrate-binding protein